MAAEARTVWEQIAPEWVQFIRAGPRGGPAREYLINPAVLSLLGAVGGRRVLDIGCGEGYFSRILASQNASVTGVDLSQGMIDAALDLERRHPVGIEYMQGDITELAALCLEPFDAVVAILVLNMVGELRRALHQLHAALRSGGILVAVILHPAFDDVGSGWAYRQNASPIWSDNRYIERIEGRSATGAPSYHRPVSDYVMAAVTVGFVLTGFLEPVYPDEAIAWMTPDQQAKARIPYSLVMRFMRPSP